MYVIHCRAKAILGTGIFVVGCIRMPPLPCRPLPQGLLRAVPWAASPPPSSPPIGTARPSTGSRCASYQFAPFYVVAHLSSRHCNCTPSACSSPCAAPVGPDFCHIHSSPRPPKSTLKSTTCPFRRDTQSASSSPPSVPSQKCTLLPTRDPQDGLAANVEGGCWPRILPQCVGKKIATRSAKRPHVR